MIINSREIKKKNTGKLIRTSYIAHNYVNTGYGSNRIKI